LEPGSTPVNMAGECPPEFLSEFRNIVQMLDAKGPASLPGLS
jgi:hypothetical protein